jgi:subtilisin family serine protease
LVLGLALAVLPAPRAAHADWVRDGEWQLRALGANTAWRYSTGAGVTVAVLDSGVDASHADLAGQVLPGADFVDGSTDGRRDPVGHGTTVAALIAGRADDGSGVAGIAPGAHILPVRVLDKANKYDDATVVAGGLRWAVDHGATVVNMSLGGAVRSDILADALAYAAAHDVVVVACTGNVVSGSGNSDVWYPAREPGVVAVAGLTAGTVAGQGGGGPAPADTGNGTDGGTGGVGGSAVDLLWPGSLTGPSTVLAAPAVNLLGARPGGYWRVQGTSFAAPLVTGTVALVRSRFPELDAANAINKVIETARDLGAPGRDSRYGYGEVDPVAALTANVRSVTSNPLDPSLDPAEAGGSGSGSTDGDVVGAPYGTDVDPHPSSFSRVVAVAAPHRMAFSIGFGAVAFMLLLGAGMFMVNKRTGAL